jgi:hypothetical protein
MQSFRSLCGNCDTLFEGRRLYFDAVTERRPCTFLRFMWQPSHIRLAGRVFFGARGLDPAPVGGLTYAPL